MTATMSSLKKLLCEKLAELNQLPSLDIEQDYEVVQHSDAINDDDDDNGGNNSSAKNLNNGNTAKNSYQNLNFHFGQLFGQRSSTVFKNYNSNDAGNSAIQGFFGRNDTIIAFQLEHPAPEFKSNSYVSYDYNKGSHKKPAVHGTGNVAESAGPSFIAMDVCIGYRQQHERIELVGFPQRFSWIKEGLTNRQVHEKVQRTLRRVVAEDYRAGIEGFYDLIVTNVYATVNKRMIQCDDEEFDLLVENMEMLVVIMRPDALREKVFDLEALKAVKDLDTVDGDISRDDDNDATIPRRRTASDDFDDFDDEKGRKGESKTLTQLSSFESSLLSVTTDGVYRQRTEYLLLLRQVY